MHENSWPKPKTFAAVMTATVFLSACGTTSGDRALSGGLIGAGTGALIGSVTGSAGKGALIGGLGGMALGALTSPRQVNFGEPLWRHSSRSRPYHTSSRTARSAEHCTSSETATTRTTTCPRYR